MRGLEARGVGLRGRFDASDLTLAAGSLTALVGPNGAGKTSLLHALAGIGRPQGEVTIDGLDLRNIPPRVRPRLLGYVPASRELAWPLRVHALITLTAPEASSIKVSALLDAMALTDLTERRVDTLSTGERSRVLIARALLPGPAVLLLDEPFANLDPLWQLLLAERLGEDARGGMTILFSTHDLDLAARLADRILVIDRGCLAADAPPAEIVESGIIARVFGVERDAIAGWRRALPG